MMMMIMMMMMMMMTGGRKGISDILGQAVALFTFHSDPWYRLKSVYTVLYAKEDL